MDTSDQSTAAAAATATETSAAAEQSAVAATLATLASTSGAAPSPVPAVPNPLPPGYNKVSALRQLSDGAALAVQLSTVFLTHAVVRACLQYYRISPSAPIAPLR